MTVLLFVLFSVTVAAGGRTVTVVEFGQLLVGLRVADVATGVEVRPAGLLPVEVELAEPEFAPQAESTARSTRASTTMLMSD
jgi:hypothetical protein